MTDVDERLLTAAKLAEQARGNVDSDLDLPEYLGHVDGEDYGAIAFADQAFEEDFGDTPIGQEVVPTLMGARANRALEEEQAMILSHMVGVTETKFDGSAMTVTLDLLDRMKNNDATSFFSIAGNPNTGKTNFAATCVNIADAAGGVVDDVPEDLVVISNVDTWDRTDVVATSMHDLAVALLERRDERSIVVLDEVSTHFDAGTYRYEVRSQWSPVAKRFAKLGVFLNINICHTGMDYHPEGKRLTTTAVRKEEQTEVQLYERWPDDSAMPSDPVYPDPIVNLEEADGYDPDDSAPWNWNLRAGLFMKDLPWPELLTQLRAQGPAED